MWDGLDAMSGNTPHWLKGERYQHFGARAYDPVTCIFMQIDPMAEKYYGLTPYHYCAGNPVMLVDSQGNQPQSIAYEVAREVSKKGIYKLTARYYIVSAVPVLAPFCAMILAGGLVAGDSPINEFSEEEEGSKKSDQNGDNVSEDYSDAEVESPSSSDEVNSTGGTKIPDSELTPPRGSVSSSVSGAGLAESLDLQI